MLPKRRTAHNQDVSKNYNKNRMATLACTLIIEGKKFEKDSDLLKNLKLERKQRHHDNHKIGRPNIEYHQALTIENEVFVGEVGGHTLLCSDYIPSDFIGNISTLKTSVFSLFPEGKKVVFFSNSSSMLNGFIIFEGHKLIRMKVVENGKIEKVSSDNLDFGELLPIEKEYYSSENVKESYDYLWGLHDLKIATKYIEQNFGINNLELTLDEVVCNKYSTDEISEVEIKKSSSEKITVKEIHDSTNKVIETLIDGLIKQKAKDSFPDVSRQTIYSIDLNNCKLVILNRTNFSPPGGTNSDITFFIQLKNGDKSISEKPFYVEKLGIPIVNFNSHEVLIKHNEKNDKIVLPEDLQRYLREICITQEFKNSLLMDPVEFIFTKHDNYFKSVFENLVQHSKLKGWIQGHTLIHILLAKSFFELNQNHKSYTANQLKDFLENFRSTNEHFKKSSDEKVVKFLDIIKIFKVSSQIEDNSNSLAIEDRNANFTTNPKIAKNKWWQFWK